MKMKKILTALLASVMVFSFAACGEGTTTTSTDATTTAAANGDVTTEATEGGETPAADTSSIIPEQTVTLNVYSQLANFQGEQAGWFADLLLEKFNVKFNIISEGDGVFATRMESGDLGDIVIFGSDGEQYQEAYSKNMLLDWNEDNILADYGPYMTANIQPALQKNAKISGGTTYGFGFGFAAGSDEFNDFDYHPDLRWDLYDAIGRPEIKELEDYVDVLKKMKEIAPTSDSGKETYGVSLFNDWDGNMVMFVKATATNFFGLDEFAMGFYDCDTGEFEDALKVGGSYERCLKFYNSLYREGLLDPDSMTQGYDGCMEDYKDGAAFMCIFGWMAAPQYNTQQHMDEGKKMLPIVASNTDAVVYGLNPGGSNRVWTIGSKTQYPELCMAIIDWLTTPEGKLTTVYGPEGMCWEQLADGSYDLTDFGLKCQLEQDVNMEAPYSGYWRDGQPQFNNETWSLNAKIPGGNGQTFNYLYWPKYQALPVDAAEKAWRDWTGFNSIKEYMSTLPYSVSKAHDYVESQKTDEFATMWDQVKQAIVNGSWQAIYATSDDEFNSILDKTRADADSYGYAEIVEWCVNEAAIRKAAEVA